MIYHYRCGNCARECDVAQSIHDPPLVDCSSCGVPLLERVIRPSRYLGVRVRTDGAGYQPGLARYPGDPRAYCDGPRAVSKLTDWHKRRGRVVADPDDIGDEPEDDDNVPTLQDFLQGEEHGS